MTQREWRIYVCDPSVPTADGFGAWVIHGRGGELDHLLGRLMAWRDDGQEVRLDWCNADEPRDYTSLDGL